MRLPDLESLDDFLASSFDVDDEDGVEGSQENADSLGFKRQLWTRKEGETKSAAGSSARGGRRPPPGYGAPGARSPGNFWKFDIKWCLLVTPTVKSGVYFLVQIKIGQF